KSHQNQKISHVKRITAVSKDPSLHQPLGIDATVASAANDVFEANRDGAQPLARSSHEHSQQSGDAVVRQQWAAFENEEGVDEGKQPVAIMKQEIADGDHHLSAIIPQKLYHLKNTSQ